MQSPAVIHLYSQKAPFSPEAAPVIDGFVYHLARNWLGGVSPCSKVRAQTL